MKNLKRVLREVGSILIAAAASASWMTILAAPFWWNEPPAMITRILFCAIIGFGVIYTAASLHSEFRLVVRVERRIK